MKRHLKYGLSALALACVSVASAADDKTRFESSGFLKSLDLLIAKQRLAEDKNKDAKLKGLDLSLTGHNLDQNSTFLSLNDSRPVVKTTTPGLETRPDFSSLLAPTGGVRGEYGHDIEGGTSRLGLTFGNAENGENRTQGLEIALQSQYRRSLQGLSAATGFADLGLAETQYKAGLSVGYSGFGIDASVLRQSSLFATDLAGYEAGFSYQANSWSARIAMSEYTEGTDLYGIENEARNIISFELGASYRLTERVGLRGGLRYYDYGDAFAIQSKNGDTSQMIFLGGRLRF
ncbi:porin family protein [Kordiimonas aquimaris]|uniref:porin n=1 Tax=Kordiimonas aquimaris TaxID=707591 RepID=UPI0021D021CD|nr:porin [Kordiimonas aquimaris]